MRPRRLASTLRGEASSVPGRVTVIGVSSAVLNKKTEEEKPLSQPQKQEMRKKNHT
jgi:hypothetical protein